MKFTCLQENFAKGLGIVARAINNRPDQPILSNVLISVADGRVKLTGFNGNTAITTYMGASVDSEGAITVPINLIKEYVSTLSAPSIDVELKEAILHLNTPKSLTKFNGLAAASYPSLPEMSPEASVIELDAAEFSKAVMSVAFSSSSDDTRPILTGILMNYSDGKLTIVSADGFRLSEKIISIDANVADFSVVIPSRTLIEVARIFGSSDDPVKLTLSPNDNLAMFESGEVLVSTRIINGDFPDYKKLIPENTIFNAVFDTEDLLEAVRLTNVFAKGQDSHSPITIHLNPEGYLKLTSISQETGENHSQISAEVEGEELTVVFNSRYLLDFLSNIKQGKLQICSNGNLTPGIIKPFESEDYIHLLMPIRNQG